MIHEQQCISKGATVKTLQNAKPCTTVSGTFNDNKTVKLCDGIFPEFDRHPGIFNAPDCPHDIYHPWSRLFGIISDFANHHVRWIDKFISMKDKQHLHNHTNWTLAFDRGYIDVLDDEDNFPDDAFTLDAKYEATSGAEVAAKQVYLNEQQQSQLADVLGNTQELFDGNLGHYKEAQVHLDVEPGAVPVHTKAYSVPIKHTDAFPKDLRHFLEAINVLKRCGPTEWASPTFSIPKKSGRVRWISDLRELNKVLKRKI